MFSKELLGGAQNEELVKYDDLNKLRPKLVDDEVSKLNSHDDDMT
jgi:hypothetical protein